jgi:hypothetical protein
LGLTVGLTVAAAAAAAGGVALLTILLIRRKKKKKEYTSFLFFHFCLKYKQMKNGTKNRTRLSAWKF